MRNIYNQRYLQVEKYVDAGAIEAIEDETSKLWFKLSDVNVKAIEDPTWHAV